MIDPVELHIYDFDDTLYASPKSTTLDPVWWFHAHPLLRFGAPGYDRRWILPNVIRARRSAQSPAVMAILLTARPDHAEMQTILSKMLRTAEIRFAHHQLKPLGGSWSDAEYKAEMVADWLGQLPYVKKVVFYDDQPVNLEAVGALVREMGLKYKGVV